jgi:hypothetical protein
MEALWLIETGYTGCGPEQAYAWATSELRARELYAERNPGAHPPKSVTLLFNKSAAEFCTIVCDEGWMNDAAT